MNSALRDLRTGVCAFAAATCPLSCGTGGSIGERQEFPRYGPDDPSYGSGKCAGWRVLEVKKVAMDELMEEAKMGVGGKVEG